MSRVVRQLKFLNKISSTTIKPQILLNPESYGALNLTFQWQNHNGHMGARKFWHEYLPTLQFYNPELKINISRVKNDKKDVMVPCKLEILSPTGSVVETLDMRDKDKESIMDELLAKVNHERVSSKEIVKV
ncbi:LAMI_0G13234g1_1 [Lachancea mirantina]|uniref:LAMI_0G13234g1_1 n=1 Tax=Lachancea mirantina TaxID=1230905 RepID=A0A1G4KBP3_9SACH|nr:LAMI_0G13234g1_1 [Lachancea mirantina]